VNDGVETRLIRCFSAIFPDLDDEQISCATIASVAEWDSIATVTLVNIIEEEFKMQVDPEDVEPLTSFEHFLRYLRVRVSSKR
jgi:acyl carrier protein